MIWHLTATEIMEGYASGDLSPVSVMQAVLDRAEAVNPALNALFDQRPEAAMAAAKASEARWQLRQSKGPLDGVPVLIKDSVAEAGRPYWRGTRARMNGPLPQEDSPPVARLKEAGAILFAKTTMPDFGLLGSGVSSAHGVTRNPWNLAMNTGGSSSGAGAAIAAGIGPLAVGTDLGGSVRLPAAQCGLYALKPSRGVVPHLPYSAARVAGPMTRSVADAALMLAVLSQPDPRARESGMRLPATVAPLSPKGLRIGVLTAMGFGPAVETEVLTLVMAAAALFGGEGAEVEMLDAPFASDIFTEIDTHFAVKAAMERDDLPPGKRHETLDFITRYCDRGDATPAKAYLRATEAMDAAQRHFAAMVNGCDFVLSPVLPMVGFAADVAGPDADRPSGHIGFTGLVNQAGLPAASIFCGFAGGMPVGLQIIAGLGRDAAVLGLSASYEQLRGAGPGFPPGLA